MAGPRKSAKAGEVVPRLHGRVITIRMPDGVLDLIDRAAADNFRSRSKEILSRLTRSLVGECGLVHSVSVEKQGSHVPKVSSAPAPSTNDDSAGSHS